MSVTCFPFAGDLENDRDSEVAVLHVGGQRGRRERRRAEHREGTDDERHRQKLVRHSSR